jgi:hypothetical protein
MFGAIKRCICLLALALCVDATAQVSPAGTGQGEDAPTAFRDTRDEIERNQALGATGRRQQIGRVALATYGKCVAEREPGEARRLLTMDFNSSAYRTSLRRLSDDAMHDCAVHAIKPAEKIGFGNLLFAGAIAEGMLRADATPLNVRLVRSGAVQVKVYAPTDAVAHCLARSLPDAVTVLFASEPESAGETAAAQPLLQAVPACSRAAGVTSRLELSVSALRAMVATAAYRLTTEQAS